MIGMRMMAFDVKIVLAMFVFLRVDGNHHPGIVGMRPIAARVVGDSEHGDEPVAIEVGWLLARPFGILRIHGGTQISFALTRRPLEKCFAGVGRGARDDVESVAGEELFRRGVFVGSFDESPRHPHGQFAANELRRMDIA